MKSSKLFIISIICNIVLFITAIILTTIFIKNNKTEEPTPIESSPITIIEESDNSIDVIKEESYNLGYNEGYDDGYEKGKTDTFQALYDKETTIEETESIETISDSSAVNTESVVSNQSDTNQSNSSNDTNVSTDEWTTDNRSDTPTDDYPGQPNGDGSYTIHNPSISADSFTWSVSIDGMYTSNAFWTKAQSCLHYYDYNENLCSPVSGLGITQTPNGPGTYNIHWSNADGSLQCDQTVILTE